MHISEFSSSEMTGHGYFNRDGEKKWYGPVSYDGNKNIMLNYGGFECPGFFFSFHSFILNEYLGSTLGFWRAKALQGGNALASSDFLKLSSVTADFLLFIMNLSPPWQQNMLQVKLGYLSTFENNLKTLANCYNINATKKKTRPLFKSITWSMDSLVPSYSTTLPFYGYSGPSL